MKANFRSVVRRGFLASLLGVGAVVTGHGGLISTAQAQGALCSEATVEGPYAFAIQGHVRGVGPIAASGKTIFDGVGQVRFIAVVNTATGQPPISLTPSGTYTVNPATCTGTAVLNIPPPGLFGRITQLRFRGVIVDGGQEVRYLITTPGVVFAGTSVKQFPQAGQ